MARKTTYHAWTVKVDVDGYFENRGEGSDFPVTVCGIMTALTVADAADGAWIVVIEKRIGDAFRCHDMDDGSVRFIAKNGIFPGGGKVPKKIVKICRDAVSRHDFAKNALGPAVSPQA